MSTGVTRSTAYPFPVSAFKSLARVAGSQDTYTSLEGFIRTRVSISAAEQPFRGGSITATSGRIPSLSN